MTRNILTRMLLAAGLVASSWLALSGNDAEAAARRQGAKTQPAAAAQFCDARGCRAVPPGCRAYSGYGGQRLDCSGRR